MSLRPGFQDICAALQRLPAYDFEVLCNDYLKAIWSDLVPAGISLRRYFTIASKLDAYAWDDSSSIIAFAYSTEEDWRDKLCGDAKKAAAYAEVLSLIVTRFVFCTKDCDEEEEHERLAALKKALEGEHGFLVDVHGLRRLASDIVSRFPGLAAKHLGIPVHLAHFDALDTYLDSPSPRWWPKRYDIREGKIYYPLDYIDRIADILQREKRCLIVGQTAAGKSALAVAFGLWWRAKEEGKGQHPEAVIFYTEALPGMGYARGEEWYQQVRGHDSRNELFIIDNCHLAPAAVDGFLRQWERNRPEHSLVLLVSRPRVSRSAWDEEEGEYFESFEGAEASLEVRAEETFWGVLRTYSDVYRRRNAGKFTPFEEDLEDPDRASRLEKLCAHNLVAAHELLEEWEQIGGPLSDVTEGTMLDGLADRYLTSDRADALVPLCALAQFEIPAHHSFVSTLPDNQVATLRRDNLLAPLETEAYGLCHRLDLHAETAALIFRAHVKRNVGARYASHVGGHILSSLHEYLRTGPENFMVVYRQLSRNRAFDVLRELTRDKGLQSAASMRFASRPLADMAGYLWTLTKNGQTDAAHGLFGKFIASSRADRMEAKAEKPDDTLPYAAYLLTQVDRCLTRQLLGKLPPELMGSLLSRTEVGLSTVLHWLDDARSSIAGQLQYDLAWREAAFRAIGGQALAVKARNVSLHKVYWLLRAIRPMAPDISNAILQSMTAAGLAVRFLQRQPKARVLCELLEVSPPNFARDLMDEIPTKELAAILCRSRLRHVAKLMRYYDLLKPAYALFERDCLPRRIAESEADEINLLVQSLEKVPLEGERLASQVRALVANGEAWNQYQDMSDALKRAQSFLKEERFAEAEPLFRKILESRPNHQKAHGGLAWCLAQRGLWNQAKAEAKIAIQRSLEKSNRPSPFHTTLGAICVMAGEHEDALHALDKGDANDSWNLYWRAQALSALGRHFEALEAALASHGKAPFPLRPPMSAKLPRLIAEYERLLAEEMKAEDHT